MLAVTDELRMLAVAWCSGPMLVVALCSRPSYPCQYNPSVPILFTCSGNVYRIHLALGGVAMHTGYLKVSCTHSTDHIALHFLGHVKDLFFILFAILQQTVCLSSARPSKSVLLPYLNRLFAASMNC